MKNSSDDQHVALWHLFNHPAFHEKISTLRLCCLARREAVPHAELGCATVSLPSGFAVLGPPVSKQVSCRFFLIKEKLCECTVGISAIRYFHYEEITAISTVACSTARKVETLPLAQKALP